MNIMKSLLMCAFVVLFTAANVDAKCWKNRLDECPLIVAGISSWQEGERPTPAQQMLAASVINSAVRTHRSLLKQRAIDIRATTQIPSGGSVRVALPGVRVGAGHADRTVCGTQWAPDTMCERCSYPNSVILKPDLPDKTMKVAVSHNPEDCSLTVASVRYKKIRKPPQQPPTGSGLVPHPPSGNGGIQGVVRAGASSTLPRSVTGWALGTGLENWINWDCNEGDRNRWRYTKMSIRWFNYPGGPSYPVTQVYSAMYFGDDGVKVACGDRIKSSAFWIEDPFNVAWPFGREWCERATEPQDPAYCVPWGFTLDEWAWCVQHDDIGNNFCGLQYGYVDEDPYWWYDYVYSRAEAQFRFVWGYEEMPIYIHWMKAEWAAYPFLDHDHSCWLSGYWGRTAVPGAQWVCEDQGYHWWAPWQLWDF